MLKTVLKTDYSRSIFVSNQLETNTERIISVHLVSETGKRSMSVHICLRYFALHSA